MEILYVFIVERKICKNPDYTLLRNGILLHISTSLLTSILPRKHNFYERWGERGYFVHGIKSKRPDSSNKFPIINSNMKSISLHECEMQLAIEQLIK